MWSGSLEKPILRPGCNLYRTSVAWGEKTLNWIQFILHWLITNTTSRMYVIWLNSLEQFMNPDSHISYFDRKRINTFHLKNCVLLLSVDNLPIWFCSGLPPSFLLLSKRGDLTKLFSVKRILGRGKSICAVSTSFFDLFVVVPWKLRYFQEC